MSTTIRSTVLAVVGVSCLSVVISSGIARAQNVRVATTTAGPATQAAPDWQQRGVEMPPMMAVQPMPPGNPPIMIQDANALYVLRGNEIFKFDKQTMQIIANGKLPEPRMKFIPLGAPDKVGAPRSGGGEIPDKK